LTRTVIVTKCTCVQHRGNSTETNKKQQNYRVRVKNNVRDKDREREKVTEIEREKEGEREEKEMRQKKRERKPERNNLVAYQETHRCGQASGKQLLFCPLTKGLVADIPCPPPTTPEHLKVRDGSNTASLQSLEKNSL